MSAIVYELGGNLYINLTNRCPCDCVFCVRNSGDGIGSADNLWLEREPTAAEVIAELEQYDWAKYGEIVFCGFGEPTCALPVLLDVAGRIKSPGVRTRLNTNGLGDLINGRPVAPLLQGLIDSVSVSLNAPDAKRYAELCRPQYGESAFAAMLEFAADCLNYIPNVTLSVVDTISASEIESCRLAAERAGVPLRVREFM
ncbi:MAG: TIGR04100 family radical SAM protein [Oscillospiraceae bacterium]|jgi:radical SAM enzyme (TIGR04100 family)|nr:TIGR04100 family radical SAM protein [Oscillospiraceae bacterium]